MRRRYARDRDALEIVEFADREIDVRRRYGDSYGYEFFIGHADEAA